MPTEAPETPALAAMLVVQAVEYLSVCFLLPLLLALSMVRTSYTANIRFSVENDRNTGYSRSCIRGIGALRFWLFLLIH